MMEWNADDAGFADLHGLIDVVYRPGKKGGLYWLRY